MALHQRIGNPTRCTKVHELQQSVDIWESLVSEYERGVGSKLPDSALLAGLVGLLPLDMAHQIQASPGMDSYSAAKEYVERQIAQRRDPWNRHLMAPSDPPTQKSPTPSNVDMDMGFMNQDEGCQSSNGTSYSHEYVNVFNNRFEGHCDHCWKWGHRWRDCRQLPGNKGGKPGKGSDQKGKGKGFSSNGYGKGGKDSGKGAKGKGKSMDAGKGYAQYMMASTDHYGPIRGPARDDSSYLCVLTSQRPTATVPISNRYNDLLTDDDFPELAKLTPPKKKPMQTFPQRPTQKSNKQLRREHALNCLTEVDHEPVNAVTQRGTWELIETMLDLSLIHI